MTGFFKHALPALMLGAVLGATSAQAQDMGIGNDPGFADEVTKCKGTHGETPAYAIRSCDDMLWGNPKRGDEWIFLYRGGHFADLKNYEQAAADFSVALDLNPNFEPALVARGMAHYKSGNYDLAIKDYEGAAVLAPNDAAIYGDREAVNMARQHFDLAIADYTKAISLDKTVPDFWNGRGATYRRVGNFEQAIKDYDHVVDMDSDSPSAVMNRCIARVFWEQELDKALADCSAAVRLSRGADVTLSRRGLVHLRMGDYAAAIADEQACLAKSPQDPFALYVMGIAETRSGQESLGKADMAKATTLDAPLVEQLAVFAKNG